MEIRCPQNHYLGRTFHHGPETTTVEFIPQVERNKTITHLCDWRITCPLCGEVALVAIEDILDKD